MRTTWVRRIVRPVRDWIARTTGLRITRDTISDWIDDRILALLQRRIEKRRKLVPEKEIQASLKSAYQLLINRNGLDALGEYLEFGVYTGTSLLAMNRALEELKLDDVRLFGFDSFEGLPSQAEEFDVGVWHPGSFRVPFELTQIVLSLEGIDWNRVILVKGWFRDTLNMELVRKYRIKKASVILIDCDIYIAAREALDFCGPLIENEAIIILDDWHTRELDKKGLGEQRAFEEFLEANPDLSSTRLEDVGRYAYRAEAFLVTKD